MEVIINKCFVSKYAPFVSVMQFVYDFQDKPHERVNHVCSFLPDEGDKKHRFLVAVFKVKNLKKSN